MVTQTIHVGDCELLEYYMDVTDAANPKWQNWENRTLADRHERQRHRAQPVPRRRARAPTSASRAGAA